MELTFSHRDKAIPSLPPGGVIDFSRYFDKEEDILNYQAIQKYENPQTVEKMIRRLTPEEYERELDKKRAAQQAKIEHINSNRKTGNEKPDDKVSAHVEFKVNEYLSWVSKKDEDKQKSSYSKVDFTSWINDWTFTDAEFRFITYQVKDPEILRVLMERKQEQAAQ